MNRLVELLKHMDAVQAGAEVGVSKGETSRELLVAFPKLVLWMIDAWATYDEENPYRKSGDGHARMTQEQQDRNRELALRHTSFAESRRHIMRMPSLSAAEQICDGTLDFAYIDADHTYPAVIADCRAYWPLVRCTGVLCGHDLDHPRDKRGLWGVRKAVEEFAAEVDLPMRTNGDLWWISKPRGSCRG